MILYIIIGLSELVSRVFKHQHKHAAEESWKETRTDSRDTGKRVLARARIDFGNPEMFTFLFN